VESAGFDNYARLVLVICDTNLKLPKDFVFGSLYLVSGIYSVGFSAVMTGVAQPLSGKTAYIPVPDGLFPIEVGTFALFGTIFLVASFFHFRTILRSV
jgi:hypothetical protein